MSDVPTQPEPTDDDDFEIGDEASIQNLREAAKRGRKEAKENAKLQREIALLRSGIDTTTKLGSFFAEHYDGELEVEAITAAASELGITPGAPSPTPDTSGEDATVAAQGRAQRDLASATATEPGASLDRDPREAGMDAFNEELKAGRNRHDASAAYFGTVLTAAANGDGRVIIDPRDQVGYE